MCLKSCMFHFTVNTDDLETLSCLTMLYFDFFINSQKQEFFYVFMFLADYVISAQKKTNYHMLVYLWFICVIKFILIVFVLEIKYEINITNISHTCSISLSKLFNLVQWIWWGQTKVVAKSLRWKHKVQVIELPEFSNEFLIHRVELKKMRDWKGTVGTDTPSVKLLNTVHVWNRISTSYH